MHAQGDSVAGELSALRERRRWDELSQSEWHESHGRYGRDRPDWDARDGHVSSDLPELGVQDEDELNERAVQDGRAAHGLDAPDGQCAQSYL